jgi:hypothetical protein
MARGRWQRWAHGPGGTRQLASGGAVIAFVAPEACGKSTLVAETVAWLGNTFRMERAHLGKPPPTLLTLLPNVARRLLGRLVPRLRAEQGPSSRSDEEGRGRTGLLHRARAVLLAWDRLALARRLARKAARGWLVVCDRYPSAQPGAADSVRFAVPEPGERGPAAWLAALENRFYRQVPAPTVILRLTVPLPVAIQRNRERFKLEEESDAYVTRRHQTFVPPSFPGVPLLEVDTSPPQPVTVRRVRRVVWQVLAGRREEVPVPEPGEAGEP